MDWLKDGWANRWMVSMHWPWSFSHEDLLRYLQRLENIGKTPRARSEEDPGRYPRAIARALFAAAKWELEHNLSDNNKETSNVFSILYDANLSKHLEAYLQLPQSAEESESNDVALVCAAFLVDHCKIVLRNLHESAKIENARIEPRKTWHGIHLLRSLCVAIDSKTPFNEQLADKPLPDWLPSHPLRKFTNASPWAANSQIEDLHHSEKSLDTVTEHDHTVIASNQERDSCKPKQYLWIKVLLEYFGDGYEISGFRLLVDLIYGIVSRKISLELGEVVLRFVSTAIPFLKDDERNLFLAPCLDLLRHVHACYGRLEKLSDNDSDVDLSLSIVTMNHLQVIFHSLLPSQTAEYIISDIQKRQQDRIMHFLHPNSAEQQTRLRSG